MNTIIDLQASGHRLERRVNLQHGGPYDNERDVPLKPGNGTSGYYLPQDCTQLSLQNKAITPELMQDMRGAMTRGEEVVLTSQDFAEEPKVTAYTRKQGKMQFNSPGPYRATEFETGASQTLTEYVREATGFPNATWAIKPQAGSYPDCPQLLVFVPAFSGDQLNEEDANSLLWTKFGETSSRPGTAPPAAGQGVQVEADSVIIGGIRIDRRHYVIRGHHTN